MTRKSRERFHLVYGVMSLACLCLLVAGCKQSAPVVRPNVAPPATYTPTPNSGNAYDTYALAAASAEKKIPEKIQRSTRLWPADYKKLDESLGPEVNQLVKANAQTYNSEAQPVSPESTPPYADGWRLLVETTSHRMEAAARERDWEKVLPLAETLARLGARTSQNGVAGALLGRNALERVRRAIAPNLATMGEGQLRRLATSLQRTLEETPDLSPAFEFERQQGALNLESLFDRLESNQTDSIANELGSRGGQTIASLKRLSAADRNDWLRALQGELDRHIEEAEAEVREPAKPAAAGRKWYDPSKERPWGDLTQNYLAQVRLLPALERTYLAKTRLLALTALIVADTKRDGKAPADLSKYPPSLTTDPYSLKSFLYRAAGREFRLYSVGANGLDDGGDSDRDGMTPDVTLESQPIGG
ncbi:MAG: hypothetical protein KF812_00425 [Fimbriimonadaceae bacterium]|nr:hypothetical protein [Fimbriimonadaceae bacterium]